MLRRFRNLRFRLSTLMLLPVAFGIGMWYLNKPQRVIQQFKHAFTRGDLETVNRMCTNAQFSVDTQDWEGSLMRHFPSPTTVPDCWSEVAQDVFLDFRESHIVMHRQTWSDWWNMRREFRFASAHTRTPPDRTALHGRTADGGMVPGVEVFKYWDYRDPITGEKVQNWNQPGDHNWIFREQRFIVNGDRVTIDW
jgi:hypothetical protein